MKSWPVVAAVSERVAGMPILSDSVHLIQNTFFPRITPLTRTESVEVAFRFY